jgi:hypothetical protein
MAKPLRGAERRTAPTTSLGRFRHDRKGQARRTELQARRAQAPGGAQALKTELARARFDVEEESAFGGVIVSDVYFISSKKRIR